MEIVIRDQILEAMGGFLAIEGLELAYDGL